MDHNMERANWNALEESYDQLLYLLNALELMVLALPQTHSPYADGFYSLWRCISQASQDFQTNLALCQKQA